MYGVEGDDNSDDTSLVAKTAVVSEIEGQELNDVGSLENPPRCGDVDSSSLIVLPKPSVPHDFGGTSSNFRGTTVEFMFSPALIISLLSVGCVTVFSWVSRDADTFFVRNCAH